MSIVSTVLAAIINDFQGEHFVIWICPAYALGDATFVRLSGHLSDVSGRRLASLALFVAIESALEYRDKDDDVACLFAGVVSALMWFLHAYMD